MPDYNAHLAQADSNISFVNSLKSLIDEKGCLRFPDWLVTACFYSAVHIVEAHIFKMNPVYYRDKGHSVECKNVNHSEDVRNYINRELVPHSPHYLRKGIVTTRENGYSDAFVDAYGTLEEDSHTSRYECYSKCSKLVKRSLNNLNQISSEFNSKCGENLPSV